MSNAIKAAFCNVQALPDNRSIYAEIPRQNIEVEIVAEFGLVSIYITQEGRKGAGAKISFLPAGAMQAAHLISLLAGLPIDKGAGA